MSCVQYVQTHITTHTHTHTFEQNAKHELSSLPNCYKLSVQCHSLHIVKYEIFASSDSIPPTLSSPRTPSSFPLGGFRGALSDFKLPAQLLLKIVGKHQGIRRICGTNSCPAVSDRAARLLHFSPCLSLFYSHCL